MNILITGVAGFIGSNLAKYFLEKNYKIYGVDNLTLGKLENISNFKKNKNFVFFNYPIHNKNFVNFIIHNLNGTKIDEVWHLAASSDILRGVKNPNLDHRDTFLTTWKVSEFCKVYEVDKIVFSSTGAVYGNHNSEYIESSTVPNPISSYGTFKLASENLLRTFQNDFLKTVVTFRFSNVLGPNATHGVIFDFFNKIKNSNNKLHVLGNGNQQKPYIHVTELIQGMELISSKVKNTYETINLGPNDQGVTVKYIAEKVISKFNKKIDVIYESSDFGWVGDIPKYKINNNKSNTFGFVPSLSSKEVVDKAIDEIFKEIDF